MELLKETKTWNEFWGMFLQVDFHKGNPERWTVREARAQWCIDNFGISKGASIVNLGCGDGLLDICLSRLGFEVTAIDRGGPVIANSLQEDDTKRVKFIEAELQKIDFPVNSFDGALILETLGLMSQEEDLELLKRANGWLKKEGKIIVDCPRNPPANNSWSKEFPSGKVTAETTFDKTTRIHQLNFEFHPVDGAPFLLHDPYCPARNSGPGITRYIYPAEELEELLEKSGYKVVSVPHYYGENYVGLMGLKK